MFDQSIKTPCIGVCSTGIGDTVCRGCKRFSHEVINWNAYTVEQKRAVDGRLSEFLSQCVSNKLVVIDKALLAWQLEVQQVRHRSHHDEYCWVFSLLKAGAGQITNTLEYGFQVNLPFRDMSLIELRDTIDQEFYILSQAHYDRYMLSPDLFGGQSS
ncbi:DUF1289 domain-containing protein [Parahaliea sp. F7430]|uniref:DUF1289 domain-containing protein n=1 Tax=Sediminihaliea albiluteola TaxID=2758564 RepID=A0A7W2TUB6_9GAMM|nr:DUF1289 domain-containing protein [Sediminihaliea albiluteola]MBA6412067.1 DUF1289 domain-containing protein [Sediminihaliea albiluteola]